MEKIKYTLFDFFGFVLPGSFILFSGILSIKLEVKELSDIAYIFESLNLPLFTGAIIGSYLIGNGIHNLGYWIHTRIGLRIWQIPRSYLEKKISPAKMDALIREFSPRNADTLELWNALRAMSHNLSIGFFIFASGCIYKATMFSEFFIQWSITAIISLLFSVQCLKRAFFYQVWYHRDRKATYEILKLKERADK